MKNRAKCRLCKSILESFHRYDYVSCKCGHISIDGGNDYFYASSIDWNNFLRVDDEGNEIIIKVKDTTQNPEEISPVPDLTKKELLTMLDEMISGYERLPEHAKSSSPTHYDISSALLLIASIFRSE